MSKRAELEVRRRTAEAYARARESADRIEVKALSPVARWYEDETGRVTTMLRRHFGGRLKEKFAPQYLMPIRARLEAHFAGVAQRLEGKLNKQGAPILAAGAGDAGRLVGKLTGRAAPPELEQKVTTKHLAEIERLRSESARTISADIGNQTWRGLRAAFEKQTDPRHLVVLAGELMDQQGWRVDRLVRTETSYAYNLAQSAALQAFPTEPGQLIWGRWNERVDDTTGKPLDKKVAEDSLVLHGQVARPGGVFTMPEDARAPSKLVGRSWSHPPNRPNDRAVLLPWMRDWGVPGWILQGGRRIDLTRLDPGRALGILAGPSE
jgi:hypothetical protein